MDDTTHQAPAAAEEAPAVCVECPKSNEEPEGKKEVLLTRQCRRVLTEGVKRRMEERNPCTQVS